MPISVNVPISTAVIELNPDSKIAGRHENGKLVLTIDTRNQNIHQRFGLGTKTLIHWGDENEFEAQELSCLLWPICYRVITREGYYHDENGEAHYFTTKAYGIDSRRHVSEVLMRAAILLMVIAGMGYRRLSWLLNALFHVSISKSSLHRWVREIAEELPNKESIVQMLNDKKPITEGHLDELFTLGLKQCVLVLKDEHGRIISTQAVDKRDEEHVKPFLQKIKDLDLPIKAFYTDGCKAYYNAIRAVFVDVNLQYDYFHVIQNAWKHLRRWYIDYRKNLKKRGENSKTPWYQEKLLGLSEILWKNRYLIFKSEEKMTEEEKAQLIEIMESDKKISDLRSFLCGVWNIFEDSNSEQEAREYLEKLKAKDFDSKNPKPFEKVINFLENNFKWMTSYLRNDHVKRNSLSETSMRVLRRLEFEHDGFRSEKGREDFLRIYQAIKYLDWNVYNPPPELMVNRVE